MEYVEVFYEVTHHYFKHMQWQMTCSGERQSDLSPWCRQQEDSKKTIGEFDCVIRIGFYKLMEHSLS